MRTYLYNCVDENSAYEVDNYPWGFRMKTKKRYWVETQDKKNGGQRVVSQTMNPKNGAWCKPKKSTYYAVIVLFVKSDGHVDYEAIHEQGLGSDAKQKEIALFIETHKENLTDFQKNKLKIANAKNEIFKKLEFSVRKEGEEQSDDSVSLYSRDSKEVKKREEAAKLINRAIHNEVTNSKIFE